MVFMNEYTKYNQKRENERIRFEIKGTALAAHRVVRREIEELRIQRIEPY